MTVFPIKKSTLSKGLVSWCVLLLAACFPTEAVIIGEVSPASDGRYIYAYRIENRQEDSFVSNWALDHDLPTPDWDISEVQTPAGWFADWLVSFPDIDLISEFNYEVGFEETLAGFSVISSFAPGTVNYFEFGYLEDGTDFGFAGTVVGPVMAQAVPENLPAAWSGLVFGSVLAVGAFHKAMRRKRATFGNCCSIG